MTRLPLFILSVLLSTLTATVDAKSKGDQIRAYQWSSDNCSDMPKGGNVDIKRNECVNIDARSFKPTIDSKRKKWLDDVNNGNLQCAVAIFDHPNCPGTTDQADSIMILPEEIDDCYTSPTTFAVGSVKFFCAPSILNQTVTELHTLTSTITSWSMGIDEQITPVTQISTTTLTTTMSQTIPTSIALRARGAEVRPKANLVHVFMKHPWSGSIICYECYTKKVNDFGWVKCFARPHEAHQCGPRLFSPNGEFTTTTTVYDPSSTTMITESVVGHGTIIQTEVIFEPEETPYWFDDSYFPKPTYYLQARSWHKKVSFISPWMPDERFCADAEWEKRGKPNTEIRLQKVHLIGGKHHCQSDTDIDLPELVVETVTDTDVDTQTTTVTGYTAETTVTETIYTSVLISTTTLATKTGPLVPTRTYWPTEYTITRLTTTTVVVTTLVPEHDIMTEYYWRANVADDRADIPVHRDL